MDKLKALFKRKKPAGTAGTQTETPKASETAPSVPAPGQTAQDTTAALSTSDPTVPPAGAAPVDAPAPAQPSATPSATPADPVAPAGGSKPQVDEAVSTAAP